MTLDKVTVGYAYDTTYPKTGKLEQLSKTEDTGENKQKTSWYTSEEMLQILHGKSEEMYEKIKNGETEPSYQIGKCSFTEKQWNKMLEKFDEVQEMFRKRREEENARKEAKLKHEPKTDTVNQSKEEQNESLLEKLEVLLSDTTASSFSLKNSEPEEAMDETQAAAVQRNMEKLKQYL